MTDEEAKILHKKACGLAIRRGYAQLSDDFAQTAVMHLFRGRKASLVQLLADFLRKEFGDIRSESGKARAQDTVPIEDYSQPYTVPASYDGPCVAPSRKKEIENAMRITPEEIKKFLRIAAPAAFAGYTFWNILSIC